MARGIALRDGLLGSINGHREPTKVLWPTRAEGRGLMTSVLELTNHSLALQTANRIHVREVRHR